MFFWVRVTLPSIYFSFIHLPANYMFLQLNRIHAVDGEQWAFSLSAHQLKNTYCFHFLVIVIRLPTNMAVQESDTQDVKSLGSGEGKKIMLTISSKNCLFLSGMIKHTNFLINFSYLLPKIFLFHSHFSFLPCIVNAVLTDQYLQK